MSSLVDGVNALPPINKVTSSSDDEKASFKDEKSFEKGADDKVSVLRVTDIGGVFEDGRAIDMGEDGKERPIVSAEDWSLRLISLDDDPTLPVWTFRLWFCSMGLSCFGGLLSQIFSFRPQTVYVSQLFLQTAAFGLGKLLEEIIPGPNNHLHFLRTSDTAFWRFINPGPFNIKEHVAIAIFTLLGSQLLGYGLAGMMRSFLVYPTFIVFPNLIPTIQMFEVLHNNTDNFLQKKRIKIFWILFIGAYGFVWEWFPEYIAPLLTGVSIICLARRDSAWVTRIFGGAAGNEGLGLFSLCFDWNYVGSGGSAYGALFQPLSTQLSLFGGVLICILSFVGVYANNVWDSQNFPFLTQLLYFENGTEYDQTLILDADYSINATKLEAVGLPFMAGTQVISKIGASLSFGATNGKQVWDTIKTARADKIDDAHYEKMKVYNEVPMWWYAGMFLASIAMALATNYTGGALLPWYKNFRWVFFIAVGFATIFLPIISTLCRFMVGLIFYVPGTEDIARMLGAALVPGKPHMGQYTKLPPRVTFTMQCGGAVICAILNYIIMKVVINANRDILLSIQGTNVWSGASIQSFNSDAITWGGLARYLYQPSGRYGIIPMSILIGLVIPIPFWLLHRKYPKLHFDGVITPMICSEIGALSGGINSAIFNTFLLCMFSQFYLRRYHPRWFRKYNFLMSAALDGGTEVMVFVYSFVVGGAGGRVVNFPNWALMCSVTVRR
ncbi:OPT oligopeptide transporter [Armillaria novae-zelandiae]|uniref:OPT oligopeptide transporter n=1 Tax=Armillaria novae-zelandiae TaxID=153914 RepID=A0AA39NTR6_9AGAR|nr:OPT oligopeptide transporter [Armillaria novae-zelandiae]